MFLSLAFNSHVCVKTACWCKMIDFGDRDSFSNVLFPYWWARYDEMGVTFFECTFPLLLDNLSVLIPDFSVTATIWKPMVCD